MRVADLLPASNLACEIFIMFLIWLFVNRVARRHRIIRRMQRKINARGWLAAGFKSCLWNFFGFFNMIFSNREARRHRIIRRMQRIINALGWLAAGFKSCLSIFRIFFNSNFLFQCSKMSQSWTMDAHSWLACVFRSCL